MEKEETCRINLVQQLSAPTILVGPPNFGMIGTIVTEFLIAHLKMQPCGSIYVPNLPAVVAVHQGQILDPIGLFYSAEKNVLVVHIAANVVGLESNVANAISLLAKQTSAQRVISVDGLLDQEIDEVPTVWYVTRDNAVVSNLTTLGMDALVDGIVSGPTALLLSDVTLPSMVALLASSHEQVADSQAAASIVAAIDEWLKFGVDSAILMDYVQKYEEKWKSILVASADTREEKNKKYVSYVG